MNREKKIKNITAFLKKVSEHRDPKCAELIDKLMKLWRNWHRRSLPAEDFAFLLQQASFEIMFAYAELEEIEAFAKRVRDAAETKRKIIREHWPPPDRTQWPYDQ